MYMSPLITFPFLLVVSKIPYPRVDWIILGTTSLPMQVSRYPIQISSCVNTPKYFVPMRKEITLTINFSKPRTLNLIPPKPALGAPAVGTRDDAGVRAVVLDVERERAPRVPVVHVDRLERDAVAEGAARAALATPGELVRPDVDQGAGPDVRGPERADPAGALLDDDFGSGSIALAGGNGRSGLDAAEGHGGEGGEDGGEMHFDEGCRGLVGCLII